jgi:hypothetical protein
LRPPCARPGMPLAKLRVKGRDTTLASFRRVIFSQSTLGKPQLSRKDKENKTQASH